MTRQTLDSDSQTHASRIPPHVSLSNLRAAVGLTLDGLAARVHEENPGLAPSRGTLSAIECGRRGASRQMLVAMSRAFGLPDDALTTDYVPRSTTLAAARKAVAA